LLVRSASLPQIGVVMALASMVAVITQVKAAWSPPMSWMMTGIEVPTTDIESMETAMLRNSPVRARFLARPCRTSSGCSVGVAGAAAAGLWVMRGRGSCVCSGTGNAGRLAKNHPAAEKLTKINYTIMVDPSQLFRFPIFR